MNIPTERIALQSDTSFNVSSELLNTTKTEEMDMNTHVSGQLLKPTTGREIVTERSTLYGPNNKDYLTLTDNDKNRLT